MWKVQIPGLLLVFHRLQGKLETRDMLRWIALHAVPYVKKSLRLENTQRSLQSRMPGSNSETRGRFCNGLDSNIVVQYSVGPIINLYGWLTAREYVHTLDNQVHPMIQTLFPNNGAVFDTAVTSVMVSRAWRWTSTSSLTSTITRFEHHWTNLVSFGDKSEEQIPTSNISKAIWRCSSRRMG
jgi:hypothetical protein